MRQRILLALLLLCGIGLRNQANGQETVRVCYNDSVDLTVPESMTHSTWHYRWQRKNSSAGATAWVTIGTTTSVNTGAVTQNTDVRCMADSLGGSNYNYTVYTATVSPYPAIEAPVISVSADSICHGASLVLSIDVLPTGGNGSFTYRWEKRTSSGVSLLATVSSAAAFTVGTVNETSTFWVVASNNCGSDTSNKVTVYVDPQVVPGTISPADTSLCYNTAATISVTGSSNVHSYQWQYTQDIDNWANAGGASSTTAVYNTPVLSYGWHYFRVVATSAMGCTATSAMSTVQVWNQLTAAAISGDQTLCYGTVPSPLSKTGSPTGGSGIYTYQWWQKTAGGTWQQVDGATGTSYQPPMLTATTQYRLRQTDATCGYVDSDPVTVTVLPQITHAQVATSNTGTICYDSVPNHNLYLLVPPSGGGDGFGYQWQDSLAGGSWNNISGADQSSYQPGALQDTTWYRLVSTSSYGCLDTSSALSIKVYERISATAIDSLSICYHTDTTLRVHPRGGGDSYTFQWQQSADGTSWISLPSTDSSYTTPLLDATTYYRVVVVSTRGCSSDTASTDLHVLPPLYPGTITAPDTTICWNTRPENIVTTSGATGSGYSCQWQWSTNGSSFSDIEGQTDENNFVSPSLKVRTWYRLQFRYPIEKCLPVYSDTVDIKVFTDSTSAHIFTNDIWGVNLIGTPTDSINICYGDSIGAMQVDIMPEGGNGTFTHHWEYSLDREAATWDSLTGDMVTPGTTSLTYQYPDTLHKTRYFRLVSVSSNQCPHASNPVTVNVFAHINAGAIPDTVICHNTAATLQARPTGGGDDYSYLWLKSEGGSWVDAANAYSGSTSDSYTTEPLTDTVHPAQLRVVVTSNLGCSFDTSSVVRVIVNTPLRAGSLSTLDSICDGEYPDSFCMTAASGGMTPYIYRWLSSTDGTNYSDAVPEENSNCYYPNVLHQTTYYKLEVISNHEDRGCGRATTNVHTIRHFALPNLYSIVNAGDTASCYNQYQTYALPEATSAFTYDWSTFNGRNITYLNDLHDTVEIFWNIESAIDSIFVNVTNRSTGCQRRSHSVVSTTHEKAPDRTVIVRKPHTNILIAQEEGDYHFQWGYTDLQTGEEVALPNSNRRYVLLPDNAAFDLTHFDYWLEIRQTEQAVCYSVSHYRPTEDPFYQTEEATPLTVTSLGDNQIDIQFINPDNQATTFEVFDIEGRLFYAVTLQPEGQQQLRLTLPARGVFIVEALKRTGLRWTEKTIVR